MGLFTSKKKRLEMEERQRQAQKEAEEACAKEGHLWSRIPYWNENCQFKDDLFDCLPLDCCIDEQCKRCGAKRRTRIDGIADFTVDEVMKAPIQHNGKNVGEYCLKIDTLKSFCIQAKKDIPSAKINKGDFFLVLEPQNPYYYTERCLSLLPSKKAEMTDEIIDYGEIPGLVEFAKGICFVDDQNHILDLREITIEEYNENFGVFKIGMLQVPASGKLVLFCAIKG